MTGARTGAEPDNSTATESILNWLLTRLSYYPGKAERALPNLRLMHIGRAVEATPMEPCHDGKSFLLIIHAPPHFRRAAGRAVQLPPERGLPKPLKYISRSAARSFLRKCCAI